MPAEAVAQTVLYAVEQPRGMLVDTIELQHDVPVNEAPRTRNPERRLPQGSQTSRKSKRRRPSSDHPIGQHRIRDLYEGRDVGSLHVVHVVVARRTAMLDAAIVDVLHDIAQ